MFCEYIFLVRRHTPQGERHNPNQMKQGNANPLNANLGSLLTPMLAALAGRGAGGPQGGGPPGTVLCETREVQTLLGKRGILWVWLPENVFMLCRRSRVVLISSIEMLTKQSTLPPSNLSENVNASMITLSE